MNHRAAYHEQYRKHLRIALGVAVGLHVAAFAFIEMRVPILERPERGRALQVVELPDEWAERSLQVVALETATDPATEAAATSARVEAPDPGAAGPDMRVMAVVPDVSLPSPAPLEASPNLTLAASTVAPAPQMTTRRPNRGIVQREGGAAAAESGYDFAADDDASREAERELGGGVWGGTRGIGVTILGGGDCSPTSGGGSAINRLGPRIGR